VKNDVVAEQCDIKPTTFTSRFYELSYWERE